MHFQSLRFVSPEPGPRLIITGAVHGSERCGTIAIRRFISELESGRHRLLRGLLTLVPITNPKAYAQGTRNGDRNLNRRLRPTDAPREFEDHVANWLCPLLAEHEGLLDLHSFTAQGKPFVMVGPEDNRGALEPFSQAAVEVALAQRLGVDRAVDGWLATYAEGVERRRRERPDQLDRHELDVEYGVGTTEYMRAHGGWALTLECGQHEDPQAPEVAYQAILNLLAHWAMIEHPRPEPRPLEGLRLFDVIDREHADDRFVRPWQSFDPVGEGELIGLRADGREVRSPVEGWIVFPAATALPGHEWFYLAQKTDRFAKVV